MIATQNWGAAMPSTANNLPPLSNIESRFTADRIPSGTPMITANAMPASANCKVAGSLSSNRSRVGRRSRMDSPKSPCTAPLRK